MPSITAVLSLFRPPQGVVDRVTRLLEQVDHVVAVDDSPAPATPGPVHEALRALGVEVVVLGENRGIAHALNVGVATARTADPAAWIMTLDQDSTLAPGFVSGSLAAFDAALAAGVPVGAVCPEKLGDVPTPDEGERDGFSLAYDPIQSGMILPPGTLADCGPFREDYFIDAVDSEYTLRMRSHGLRVVRAPGVRLEHEMGEPRPMRFLGSQLTFQGKPAHVPYEAPFRVYYIARNMLTLSREYRRAFPDWLARRWKAEALHGTARALWGPHRFKIVLATLCGARDHLRGTSGRIPARLARRLAV